MVGLPTLAKRWQTNQSPEMVGKRLADGRSPNDNIGPMLESDHKFTFSQKCWGMAGKELASQHHATNLVPTLGQQWNSADVLVFLKNRWQLVETWSDSQCLSAYL